MNAEDARKHIVLSLGKDDPRIVEKILRDLHTQERLSDAEIVRLPPWELDRLDDQYGWLSD